MNSRELVTRALRFDRPARVPRQLWLLPWAEIHHPEAAARMRARYPDDIISSPLFLTEVPAMQGDRHAVGTSVDEWGCVFENLTAGIIGEVKDPILADWSNLERIRAPRERLTVNRDEVNRFCAGTDRFVLSGIFPRIFEQLQFLRGTENLLCDLLERPSELDALMRILHEFYLEELEVWANTDVDGLMFMDDWGSQAALMINPRLWRSMFRPLYEEYFRIAKDHGKFIFFHSDGHILDILEDFVELGVDAINSQIFLMGLESIEARFGGRITFWGDFDRQHLLPHGSREEIEEAARRMREGLHRDGGLIAQCEFGPGAIPANVEAFLACWGE
jgi:uroporphyrinogen decarboxylase